MRWNVFSLLPFFLFSTNTAYLVGRGRGKAAQAIRRPRQGGPRIKGLASDGRDGG